MKKIKKRLMSYNNYITEVNFIVMDTKTFIDNNYKLTDMHLVENNLDDIVKDKNGKFYSVLFYGNFVEMIDVTDFTKNFLAKNF